MNTMIYAQPTVATLAADRRDAYLFSLYSRLRLTARGRMMILSGLGAFARTLEK